MYSHAIAVSVPPFFNQINMHREVQNAMQKHKKGALHSSRSSGVGVAVPPCFYLQNIFSRVRVECDDAESQKAYTRRGCRTDVGVGKGIARKLMKCSCDEFRPERNVDVRVRARAMTDHDGRGLVFCLTFASLDRVVTRDHVLSASG
jgi:hypothetical protein